MKNPFEKKDERIAMTFRTDAETIKKLDHISKKFSRPGNYVSKNEIIQKAVDELFRKVNQ